MVKCSKYPAWVYDGTRESGPTTKKRVKRSVGGTGPSCLLAFGVKVKRGVVDR